MYPHETGRRQRMVTRTMNRHLAAWWEEHNNHPSIVRLNELGFLVKPIPHFTKDGYEKNYYRDQVDVNGTRWLYGTSSRAKLVTGNICKFLLLKIPALNS